MESLLSFLIWAGLIVFMFRIGRDAQIRAQEHAHHTRPDDSPPAANPDLRWVAPEKDTDPVCAKTVRTAKAKPSVYAGQVYYFCSRECREIFEAAPNLYVGQHDETPPRLELSRA